MTEMTKLLSILFVGLLACKPPLEVKQKNHFNCDSLVVNQTQWLEHQKMALKKLTSVDGGRVTESLRDANQVEWKKELAPFAAIDWINKPSYRDSYDVSIFQDSKSNLKVKCWKAKTKGPPLRTLTVSFLNEIDKIKSIEAEMEVESLGITSHKALRLEFSFFGGITALESYEISGFQKFFVGTNEHFTLEGIVLKK